MTTALVYDEAPRLVTGTVTIRDIDMPFWSMVGFMLKWAIAAIPAAFIFAILAGVCFIFFTLILGGIGTAFGGAR